MAKHLIIVESPAKIKTLQKFLGSGYIFESSLGHVRDLPSKEFGIDLENDFEPKYESLEDKKQVIKKLRDAAKQCDTVILSPDPDREGEAIAWHIQQILPAGIPIQRVSFNSITREAVQEALAHPRNINQQLVDAQQARRLLDRIVGYKISPLLNRRMQRGRTGAVSAGRVQSVALKLVVEREKEIEAFVPVEYWNIAALLGVPETPKHFKAHVHSVDSKRVEKELVEGKDVFLINNQEVAHTIVKRLEESEFQVTRVERKEKRRRPVPPFITSTLQQEASRHHSFSSTRTMRTAQALYEGVDLGNEGAEGLITYMRTDSVRIAPEALTAARTYIQSKYGAEYLPDTPQQYSTKKSAQDAHEAIRPTSLEHPPEAVEKYLTRDQFLLYSLIWKRFIASQMVPAVYDTVSADIQATQNVLLRATGSVIKFPGFLAVYEEKQDEDEAESENATLPSFEEGQHLHLDTVTSEQAFTKPPPRFSEASLVKELEKSGIGRPSTYATIMQKIQNREYTTKEGNRLKPTELGRVIAEMLETNFTDIMDVGFTADMEDKLEKIAEGDCDWKQLVRDFWKQFLPTLEKAEKEATVPKIPTDIDCPKCGNKLQKVWFRNKYFYGCSSYPECDFTSSIEELTFDKSEYAEDFNWDQKCPNCGSDMVVRHGKYGAFLGCSNYPECRGIVNIPKKGEQIVSQEDLPNCPAIGCDGKIMARRSRFGKVFYSCSNFPDCDVIVNNLDDLGEKYPNHPKTAYVKKPRGRAAKKDKETGKAKKKAAAKPKKPRQTKPKTLSPDLAAIVGTNEMPRGEVLKQVWVYIKAQGLQDKENGRIIKPDEKLAKVFGNSEPIDMFKLAGILGKHME